MGKTTRKLALGLFGVLLTASAASAQTITASPAQPNDFFYNGGDSFDVVNFSYDFSVRARRFNTANASQGLLGAWDSCVVGEATGVAGCAATDRNDATRAYPTGTNGAYGFTLGFGTGSSSPIFNFWGCSDFTCSIANGIGVTTLTLNTTSSGPIDAFAVQLRAASGANSSASFNNLRYTPVGGASVPFDATGLGDVTPPTLPGYVFYQANADLRGGTLEGRFTIIGSGVSDEQPSLDIYAGQVVPEPSTYMLLATGIGALGLVARRRRNIA